MNPAEFVFTRYFAGKLIGRTQVCAEHVCFLTGTLLPTLLKEGGSYGVTRNEAIAPLCEAGNITWGALLKPN